METQVQELIRQYGEPAFQVMMRQVALEAMFAGWAAIVIAVVVIALVVLSIANRSNRGYTTEGVFLAGFAAAFLSIFGVMAAIDWYLKTTNPVYYAIRGLLER